MKNLFYVLLVLSILGTSSACKKANADSDLNLGSSDAFSLADLIRLNNMDTKSLFTISHSSIASHIYDEGKDFNKDFLQVAASTNKDLISYEGQLGSYSLKISDRRKEAPNVLNCDRNDSRNTSVFGKVQIAVGNINGYIYVPEKMKLIAPAPAHDGQYNFQGTPINRSEGITLKWNADPSNQKGVILKISCPNCPSPSYIISEVLKDNGSFFIGDKILANVPNNQVFDIELIRGNYHISDSNEDLLLCTTSVLSTYNIRQ